MKRLLGVLVSLCIVGGAGMLALAGEWPWRRLEESRPAAAPPPAMFQVATDTLRAGEVLADVFQRHGIEAGDILELVKVLGINARQLQAGQVFRFEHASNDRAAVAITVRASDEEEVRASRIDRDWAAERRQILWQSRVVRLEGRVETSLYDAMATALVDEPISLDERIRLAWDLADIFAWSVDFTLDLQPRDDFAVVFERETSELGDVRLGRILAGEIEVNGRRMQAFRFAASQAAPNVDRQSGEQFFDENGQSLRRAFLRTPVEFRRVSSGFARSRKHPVLGVWRRHEGVDYAADAGAPVRAAGDGEVSFLGWSGGYGRMVEIRHANGVSTRYAHLRAFGPDLRTGVRILQGEVVGYVGSSGLANGPHLHYEFRRRGVALDPRRANASSGTALPSELKAAFQLERDRLARILRPAAVALAVPKRTD